MVIIKGILIILAGVLLLFGGWRIYKKLVFLLGFVVGVIAGVMIISSTGFAVPITILIILGAGLLGAILFSLMNFAVFIILGALVGIFLAQTFASSISPIAIQWIVTIGLAALCAIIALIFRKISVVACTSIIGSYLTVKGILFFFPGQPEIFPPLMEGNTLVVVIVLAILGAVIQLIKREKKKD